MTVDDRLLLHTLCSYLLRQLDDCGRAFSLYCSALDVPIVSATRVWTQANPIISTPSPLWDALTSRKSRKGHCLLMMLSFTECLMAWFDYVILLCAVFTFLRLCLLYARLYLLCIVGVFCYQLCGETQFYILVYIYIYRYMAKSNHNEHYIVWWIKCSLSPINVTIQWNWVITKKYEIITLIDHRTN